MDADYLTGPHSASAKLHAGRPAAVCAASSAARNFRPTDATAASHLHFFCLRPNEQRCAAGGGHNERELHYRAIQMTIAAGDQACRFCFGPRAEAVSTQVALKKRKNAML
jgi:hypothetical protein